MSISPQYVVSPPGFIPPKHNLMDSGYWPEDQGDGRWEGGFTFHSYNCVQGEASRPCGAPGEVDRATVVADSGTWSITFFGQTTAPLAYNATSGDIQFALEALSNVDPGDVLVTGFSTISGLTTTSVLDFTWIGAYAESPVGAVNFTTTDISLAGVGNGISTVAPLVAFDAKIPKKDDDGSQFHVDYSPYQIVVPFQCSTFGMMGMDYQAIAMDRLDSVQYKALEYELWNGNADPTNPSLVRTTPNDDLHILNPGGAAAPTPVAPALALSSWLRRWPNCSAGGRGMIHATPALVERWVNLYDALSDGTRLVTIGRGDVIVNGAGYSGNGPLGQPSPPDGTVWAYATGPVDIRMGDKEMYPKDIAGALDRSTNTVVYRAERTASAVFDPCCTFAILVDVCS